MNEMRRNTKVKRKKIQSYFSRWKTTKLSKLAPITENLNNPMSIEVIELISKRLLMFGPDGFTVEIKYCRKKVV